MSTNDPIPKKQRKKVITTTIVTEYYNNDTDDKPSRSKKRSNVETVYYDEGDSTDDDDYKTQPMEKSRNKQKDVKETKHPAKEYKPKLTKEDIARMKAEEREARKKRQQAKDTGSDYYGDDVDDKPKKNRKVPKQSKKNIDDEDYDKNISTKSSSEWKNGKKYTTKTINRDGEITIEKYEDDVLVSSEIQ